MVTCATSAVSICSLGSGFFLDTAGPRISSCMASIIFACGLTALSLAGTFGDYFYLWGFIGLAIGGPAVFTSTNNFSDLFAKNASGIIAAQSGAFQVSSIMMVIGAFTATRLQIGFSQICSCYLIVPALIFVTSYFTFPDKAFGTEEGPGHHGEPHKLWLIRRILLATEKENRKPHGKGKQYPSKEDVLQGKGGIFEPLLIHSPGDQDGISGVPELAAQDLVQNPVELYNIDIWKQVKSHSFLVIVAYLGFFILTVNFSIATIYDQLRREESTTGSTQSEELASNLNSWFNVLSPIGGLCGIPFAGAILSKLGLSATIVCQGIVSLTYLLCTVPGIVPFEWKTIGYFAFGVNRPFALGIFTTYLAEIFGFKNYGKLFGFAQLASSMVVPLQFFLIWLVHSVLQESYFGIDLGLIVVQVLFVCLVPYYLTSFVFSGFFFRMKMPETRLF